MPAPLPHIVSRYLRNQGFPRGTTANNFSGYTVRTRKGHTEVTYTLNTSNPALTPQRRRELVSAVVHAMEKALSARYTVILFEPADGTSYRLTLPGDTA